MAEPVRPNTSLVPSPSLHPSVGTEVEHFLFSCFVSLNGLLFSLLLPSPTCAVSVMEGKVGTEVAAGLLVRELMGEGDLSNGKEGEGEGEKEGEGEGRGKEEGRMGRREEDQKTPCQCG